MSTDPLILQAAKRLFYNDDLEDVLDHYMQEQLGLVLSFHPRTESEQIADHLTRYHALEGFKEHIKQLTNDAESK